jgi:hypothetical protein
MRKVVVLSPPGTGVTRSQWGALQLGTIIVTLAVEEDAQVKKKSGDRAV